MFSGTSTSVMASCFSTSNSVFMLSIAVNPLTCNLFLSLLNTNSTPCFWVAISLLPVSCFSALSQSSITSSIEIITSLPAVSISSFFSFALRRLKLSNSANRRRYLSFCSSTSACNFSITSSPSGLLKCVFPGTSASALIFISSFSGIIVSFSCII